MTLRLDPSVPMLWRSPTSVQFGVDPPRVVLTEVTAIQEQLLAALAVGVTAGGLEVVAQGRLAERDALLATVTPALLEPTTTTAEPLATIAVSGTGALVDELSECLASTGTRVLLAADAADLAETAPDLAILVTQFVLPPELHALWLRRDVPHIPAVFSDTAVFVGPVIEPGAGPCLLCLELHRRDEDPSWPAIATQLLGRRGRAETPLLVIEAVGVLCRLALERVRGGAATVATSVRIDAASGRRTLRRWEAHPECGCRGLGALLPGPAAPTPGRRETGWAAAARRAPVPG